MINGDFVRSLGNLPGAVRDEHLAPHLKSAVRYVEKRIKRSLTDEDDDDVYGEAAGCMTIYFALPVLNTFYLNGVDRVARKVAEMDDFVFSGPADIEKLRKFWKERADLLLTDPSGEGFDDVDVDVI